MLIIYNYKNNSSGIVFLDYIYKEYYNFLNNIIYYYLHTVGSSTIRRSQRGALSSFPPHLVYPEPFLAVNLHTVNASPAV